MSLFIQRYTNAPLRFDIVDVTGEDLATLQQIITSYGGEVASDGQTIVKFTKREQYQQSPCACFVFYDIHYITECVRQSRIVEPEPYRLGMRFPGDDRKMIHFLLGNCTAKGDQTGNKREFSNATIQGSDSDDCVSMAAVALTQNSSEFFTGQSSISPNAPSPANRDNTINEKVIKKEAQSPINKNLIDESQPVVDNDVIRNSMALGNVREDIVDKHEKRPNNLEYELEIKPKIEMLTQSLSVRENRPESPTIIFVKKEPLTSPTVKESNENNLIFKLKTEPHQGSSKKNVWLSTKNARCVKACNQSERTLLRNPAFKQTNDAIVSAKTTIVTEKRSRGDKSADEKNVYRRKRKKDERLFTISETSRENEIIEIDDEDDTSTDSLCDTSSAKNHRSTPKKNERVTIRIREEGPPMAGPSGLNKKHESQSATGHEFDTSEEESHRDRAELRCDSFESSDDDNVNEINARVKKAQRTSTARVKAWRAKLITHNHAPVRWHYSQSERTQMLKYLINNNCIRRAKGLKVWQEMIASGSLKNRTPQSLLNHFKTTVLPYIEEAGLTEDILKQFQSLRNRE